MKNKVREANIYMIISKTFSGLNMNALKYLLPLWISPLTGVTLRCTFAALAFWIIGMFTKPEASTRRIIGKTKSTNFQNERGCKLNCVSKE